MSSGTLPRLFWVGDSISVHYYPYLARFLEGVAHLEVRGGYREAIKNINHPRGSNCGDSSMVLAFLASMFSRPDFSADWIVFNCGLHDIKTDPSTSLRQVDESEYARNLADIIALIHSQGRRAVWINTTPVDDEIHNTHASEVHRHQKDVEAYNAIAQEIMSAHRIPCVDLHQFTSRLDAPLYMDHVHYPESIRQLQAAYLAGRVGALVSAVIY